MNHILAKTILITRVIELISKEYKIPISEARDRLYKSNVVSLIEDDETGLYGDSAWYIFSLYESHLEKNKQKIEKRT